ncbi:MAG: class I SAM-dependent methyltransferase [Rhodospirillales bacterium]|nr:class I SAM-dependent methyltransferase [Rhodospirillales bacterium]MDP6645506.1 class I SAM-dependent methyltransferase [Rhodospirillales bacterium]MDP6843580.1 class I SAM-dependent methyltransferase [Rhodospirillales bacterium]
MPIGMPTGEQLFKAAVQHQIDGNLGEAERLYQSFLTDHPHRDDAYFGYGLLCLGAGRKEEAVGHFERALFIAPGNVDYWANLATANYSIGRINDAGYAHLRALRIEPGNIDIQQLRDDFAAKPHVFGESAIHSAHAPARQVYMSACVDILGKSLGDTPPPLRILEIGSYMGASLLTWAAAAERLYRKGCEILCIDPWGDSGAGQYKPGVQQALESQIAYEIFRHNAAVTGKKDNVSVIEMRATSRAALPLLGDKQFHLIYVDGGHFYDDANFDIGACHRLLSPGGIMCGDDLELQAHQCDMEFLRANTSADYVTTPNGEELHPGVTLAVHEFFGKVSAFEGFWAMRKQDGGGYQQVEFSGATGIIPGHWPEHLQDQARAHFAENQTIGALIG